MPQLLLSSRAQAVPKNIGQILVNLNFLHGAMINFLFSDKTTTFNVKVEAEMRGTLLLWPALLHGPSIVLASTIVTSISPDRIGYGGGTINIHGEGFATDGFSQFDPTKGNKVQDYKRKRLE